MYKLFINLYKKLVSPALRVVFGPGCRHLPTCSEYSSEAVSKYGLLKGGHLTLRRLSRCHPFAPGGYDPVS